MKKFYSHFVSKILFIVLLSCICMSRLWAQTYIPTETINGDSVWTKAKSPYILEGKVTVNITLTIEPGVVVQFPAQSGGGLSLDVKGTLIAKGTAVDKITFQGPGATGLDGYNNQNNVSGPVYIESSSTSSVLQYVTVDGMGHGYNGVSDFTAAIDVSSGYCSITNCIIQNTRGTGVLFENQSFATFSDDTLNSNRVGLKFENSSDAVSNNIFSANSYLDLITELDNLPALSNNNPLHIGLTSNLVMQLRNEDTLNGYNYDYSVLAGLTVQSGKTLTIEAGAKVIFPAQSGGGLSLDVKGTLIAKGTATNKIIFQGPGAAGLDGYNNQNNISGPVYIESSGSSTSSVLQYVTVDGMGHGYNGVSDFTAAIDVKSSYCSVTNCIIQNIRGTGLLFEQFYNTEVSGNTFSNDRVGLKFENTSGIVSNNKITNSSYLDVITELDNMSKLLTTNNPLHIGFTSNLTMSLNDTLTSYNYDYRPLAALTISVNKTLTIQPGVIFIFPAQSGGGLSLNIKGTLIAKGTADTYITFQGPGAAGLDGYNNQNNMSGPISIENSSVNSVMQYITIDALGHGYNGVNDATAAININSNCTNISNCIFQNIRGTGITIQNASPYIAGTCFNNNRGGIYSTAGKAKVFSSNFVGNSSFGIKNASTTDTLTADSCWWNSTLGPTEVNTNPVGGDIASDYVLYTPWLTNPYDCSEYIALAFPDCSTGILPITLLNFQTTLSNNIVNCNWQTTNETNTSYFIVQHSKDGINFTNLNKVYAAGNSSTTRSYNFVDRSPNSGINYYRLQMVDKDGKFSYSRTIPINITTKLPFAIYPNPVKDNLFIQVQRDKAEKVTVQIMDMQGKVVLQKAVQLGIGVTILSLPTSSLSKGSYFTVIKGETIQKKLFIKE